MSAQNSDTPSATGGFELGECIGSIEGDPIVVARDNRYGEALKNLSVRISLRLLQGEEAQLERAPRAIEALRDLRDPNVQGIFELIDVDGSQKGVSLEYVDSRTLAEYCAGWQPGAAATFSVLAQLARAGRILIARGVAPRLEAEAVRVDEAGLIKITPPLYGTVGKKGAAAERRFLSDLVRITVEVTGYSAPKSRLSKRNLSESPLSDAALGPRVAALLESAKSAESLMDWLPVVSELTAELGGTSALPGYLASARARMLERQVHRRSQLFVAGVSAYGVALLLACVIITHHLCNFSTAGPVPIQDTLSAVFTGRGLAVR